MLTTLAGAALGGTIDWLGQSQANEANARQAADNRKFQERMSNTAYQRAVADMKAAGLNPALAYQQGGASAPSGATATMQNAFAGAANNASDAATRVADVAQRKAAAMHTINQAKLTEAQTKQLNIESVDRLLDLKNRVALGATEAKLAARLFAPTVERAERESTRVDQENYRRDIENKLLGDNYAILEAQLNADLASTRANARSANAGAALKELEIPAATNAKNAAETWAGRNVSPWLKEISAAIGLAGGGLLTGIISNKRMNAVHKGRKIEREQSWYDPNSSTREKRRETFYEDNDR